MPPDQSLRAQNAFTVGDHYGTDNICNPEDLADNLRAIGEAKDFADLVLVAHHFNISDGERGDGPPRYVRDFARAAIDAGADVFIGHGWHRTMGIEIYKNRPIIYGIGNFIGHSEFTVNVPYDSYEAWGHDVERLQTLRPNLHPLHPGLDRPSDIWWSSAVIEIRLENGVPAEVVLTPVELGRDVEKTAQLTRPVGRGRSTDGRPFLAEGKNAEAVLERFQRLSQPFNTEIRIEGTKGRIACT